MSKKRSNRHLKFSEPSPSAVCALCHNHHSHTSSPKEWKNQHAREYVVSMDVPADSVVCRPCRQDVTRVIAAEYNVMPRWGKESVESSNSYCCVQNCSELSIVHASMCSSDEFMQIQGIEFQNEPIPVPTPLCKSHYHAVYDALQTRHKNCRTCGKRLRMGMDRPCPQPQTIQKYLYDTLHLTWDTEQNMQNVRERVGILLKGCKCMTGCKNRVC